MNYTYAASSNTATNGVALGAAGQDVRVYRILIGAPVASGNIVLYNSAVAVGSASTNIAFKATLPGSLPTTGAVLAPVIDFGSKGLPLDGGNLQIDQTMQVTVVWDLAPKNE